VTSTPTPIPRPEDEGEHRLSRSVRGPRGHIGWIIAAALAVGLVVAVLLVAAPFIPAQESRLTGAVLCGFAVGWVLLAVLSVRFTDQPQRWAAAPALLMGLGGLVLLAFGSSVQTVLSWVWPPVTLALAIWMIARVRRQLRSSGARWLLYLVIGGLALASIGGGYETVREAMDSRTYPAPGQLIDVGGHRLHLRCTGSGSPTVVLAPGAGHMSSSLGWITPAVARETRVCVYDRAGRGWSEPADPPQDGLRIATDLHTLLRDGQVPGPYVLAGHSFGGLYVLTFAARYPDEVAGMALLDSTAPASGEVAAAAPGDRTSYDVVGRVSALASSSARLGLGRLFATLAASGLPPRARDEMSAKMATADSIRSTIEEYVRPSAAEPAAALTDFDDKPLVVLTAGSGHDAAFTEAQNRLATLSTNSAHRVVAGATHASLVSEQRDAAASTQAVLDVVSAVRSGQPLVR
jgi:pimeloyl-ACP methyl ester carboxylesterase